MELTGDLEYGVQWFFKNNDIDGSTGAGRLNSGGPLTIGTLGGTAGLDPSAGGNLGFSYSLVDAGGAVRAVLKCTSTR